MQHSHTLTGHFTVAVSLEHHLHRGVTCPHAFIHRVTNQPTTQPLAFHSNSPPSPSTSASSTCHHPPNCPDNPSEGFFPTFLRHSHATFSSSGHEEFATVQPRLLLPSPSSCVFVLVCSVDE
ncbi:hypothetical protein TcWFU_001043 [Taenia crassiceps]